MLRCKKHSVNYNSLKLFLKNIHPDMPAGWGGGGGGQTQNCWLEIKFWLIIRWWVHGTSSGSDNQPSSQLPEATVLSTNPLG